MSLEVKLFQGESQDALLRRFQKQVQTSGILREAKAKSRFVSNRDAARLKAKNSARRRRQEAKRRPR
jgi:ribosomal protein S21